MTLPLCTAIHLPAYCLWSSRLWSTSHWKSVSALFTIHSYKAVIPHYIPSSGSQNHCTFYPGYRSILMCLPPLVDETDCQYHSYPEVNCDGQPIGGTFL